ncbi:MAG: helix-hairpin-helix domain-containing protein [Lachnospiraceae bacterium]|nr:helix-hairpin-helix domain-containing protein [Lachnospiraceae bacterium]
MDQKLERMKEISALLKEASRAYYQDDAEIMSNLEYDRLYEELTALEAETSTVLSGSPTMTVGYEALDSLPKERHESPMLSLDKTKSPEDLAAFAGEHEILLSWKLDGLTVVLTYQGGSLSKAVTRGNGEIGEVITNNARVFQNIPLKIPYQGDLVVRGEAIITYPEFEKINEEIADVDARYKNPRNLCSGSVRQLNNEITAKRHVRFYAFALVQADGVDFANSRARQLEWLKLQGFETVEYKKVTAEQVPETVSWFAEKIQHYDVPSDGLVALYDDISYGQSLGRTAKFPRDSIAFKWQDETRETHLLEIEWSPSRTGMINPIAVFEPVGIEGSTVSRASVHNLSIMKALRLGVGDLITVYKANMIIPQIAENLTGSGNIEIPKVCPVCGGATEIRRSAARDARRQENAVFTEKRMETGFADGNESRDSFGESESAEQRMKTENMAETESDAGTVETLYCTNPQCSAKKIKLFTLFVSRDALNIEGLSEATLEKFISCGFIHTFADIFHLSDYRNEIVRMDGFGEKSYANLIQSIERARDTTLPRLLYGIGIPNIGVANAKLLCRSFDFDLDRICAGTVEEFAAIEGLGEVIAASVVDYFADEDNRRMLKALLAELHIERPQANENAQSLAGKTFVITGSVEQFANRSELKAFIEERGGKVTGSVTKKTDYLINNDTTSNSTKNKKAKELRIPILSETDFLDLCGSGQPKLQKSEMAEQTLGTVAK